MLVFAEAHQDGTAQQPAQGLFWLFTGKTPPPEELAPGTSGTLAALPAVGEVKGASAQPETRKK